MNEPTEELRRPLAQGERLLRCVKCGRVQVPLNDAELWHYVRTGEGLTKGCPRPLPFPRCKWESL